MAEIGTLNTFSPNTTISSSLVNANFADIKTAFNSTAVLTDTARTITVTHLLSAAVPLRFTAWADGSVPYIASANGSVTQLAKGTARQVLQMNAGATAPEWTSALSVSTLALSTPLPVTSGGTGLATVAAGDILYASASNTLAALTKGAARTVLQMNAGATAPEWTNAASLATLVLTTGFAAHTPPSANDTYTLGTSGLRWSTIYGVLGNFSGVLTCADHVNVAATKQVNLSGGGDTHLAESSADVVALTVGGTVRLTVNTSNIIPALTLLPADNAVASGGASNRWTATYAVDQYASTAYYLNGVSTLFYGTGYTQLGPASNIVAIGTGGLAQAATTGFAAIPTVADAPNGTPANIPTGFVPLALDATGNKLYVYSNGSWRFFTPDGP